MTEEERAARGASAAARAADRRARTARDQDDYMPSSIERADMRWADRARTLRLSE
jgi:hypothetical protein